MKRTLALSALAILLISAPALAMEHGDSNGSEKTFEQRREGILKMLDNRIESLKKHKECVTNAKTDDDMKVCKKNFDEEMERMRERMKEHRKEKMRDHDKDRDRDKDRDKDRNGDRDRDRDHNHDER